MNRFIPCILLFASLSAALSTTYVMNATIEPIEKLVDVHGEFSFSKVIPGQEYSQLFTVSWAVPSESLAHLEGQRVVVHVLAFSDNSSWIVFRKEGQTYRSYAFDLECLVSAGACSNSSILSKTVEAIVRVPFNASSRIEAVQFTASLSEEYYSAPSGVLELLQEQARRLTETFFPSVATPTLQPATSASSPYSPSSASPAAAVAPSPIIPQVVSVPAEAQGWFAPETRLSKATLPTQGSKSVELQVEQQPASPLTGLVSAVGSRDALFVLGMFSIVSVLLILHKLFPERPEGLEGA
ncbi:hypothetical protein HZC09_00505 [Candidatus Micrarchaeota archaeon]|nr:hypothetical protein [Candidatus Micrarchaeota archaeon]